jgi:hypothetical protein
LARRMSGSSVPIYSPSALKRPLLGWAVIGRQDRIVQVPPLALLVAWFTYTRLYFFLHPRGLTFDPSLFMYLTGKPDPSCGLTRTFAWTWRGDLAQAVRVYPLGPIVFVFAAAFVVYLGISVLTGQQLAINIPRRLWLTLIGVSLVALAANWTAKLIWLGM